MRAPQTGLSTRVGRFRALASDQLVAFGHRLRYPGDLRWRAQLPSPEKKLDAAAVQVGSHLYVLGGFSASDRVCSFVDVLDLESARWVDRFETPSTMAQTHLAFASDGLRYIYAVSGQRGPFCRPAVPDGFVLDTADRTWRTLPNLPEPRYAASMQLWRGRLHVIGGSKPDRYTPATDHWSLGVHEGEALEAAWQDERAVPLGATHRASAVVGDDLYLFGGQQGDFVPLAGDAQRKCNGRTQETFLSATFVLADRRSAWQRLADMPVACSHTEPSVVVIGTSVLLLGGQVYKDPQTFILKLTDVIQEFDTCTGAWRILGHLPYRVKEAATAYHQGWIWALLGQRDCSAREPSPGRIEARVWRAELGMRHKRRIDSVAE